MRSQVEQDAGARKRLLPPGAGLRRGSKAIEAAFELDEPPEKLLAQDLCARSESRRPSGDCEIRLEHGSWYESNVMSTSASFDVMVNGLSTTTCFPASRARRAMFEVTGVRSGHDDKLDGIVGEQRRQRTNHFGLWSTFVPPDRRGAERHESDVSRWKRESAARETPAPPAQNRRDPR